MSSVIALFLLALPLAALFAFMARVDGFRNALAAFSIAVGFTTFTAICVYGAFALLAR